MLKPRWGISILGEWVGNITVCSRISMIVHHHSYRLAPSVASLFLALLVVATGVVGAHAQDRNPIFTVSGVTVDETAASASNARDVALAAGQLRAAQRMFRRLIVRADEPFLPRLTDETVARLVQNIEVSDEKTSSTRYLATLRVAFKPDIVREHLRDAGLRFSETVSRPRLVLPVFEAAGAINLWDPPNAWREAWEARGASADTVVPLLLPEGDLQDIGSIGPIQALAAETRPIQAIAARYRVRDILVAHATLVQDLAANRPLVHVSLRHTGPTSGAVSIETFVGESRAQVGALLAEAVARTVERLEDEWKRDNYLRFDEPVSLSASFALGTLSDWLEMRRRLGGAAVIQNVELASITRSDVQVVIHYLGGPEQLGLALAQRDIDLVEEGGFWTLRLTRRAEAPRTR
ncbi:MAG: DUF2066 domain-containing protein [Alphaproteobacteria bacterium]|nr:DUF2066 domain-containing protein [Alphaproteobacteria bacterium]